MLEITQYLFEPKNIQKMELLVMATLKWRMNPVTPISFLDYIVRRIGLKTHLLGDFFNKCEDLILSLVSDSRFMGYQPSVLATATMLHVIDLVGFFNSIDYQNQLLDVLKTTKDKLNAGKSIPKKQRWFIHVASLLKGETGAKMRLRINDSYFRLHEPVFTRNGSY